MGKTVTKLKEGRREKTKIEQIRCKYENKEGQSTRAAKAETKIDKAKLDKDQVKSKVMIRQNTVTKGKN